MKIDTIKERIANAEATLAKKNATLERHQKSADKMLKNILSHGWDPEDRYCKEGTPEHNDAYWAICDYDDKRHAIQSTEKAIETLNDSIKKYTELLNTETVKADNRNIQVIWDFLDEWEKECTSYFLEQYDLYQEAYTEYREESRRLHTIYDKALTKDEAQNARKAYNDLYDKFNQKWSHVLQFNAGAHDWETNMRNTLANEKVRKYDDLVNRCQMVCGNIVDTSNLHIGMNGNLNGVVEGTDGKARVETIGAGGYNIQCYHFRTLIHKLA